GGDATPWDPIDFRKRIRTRRREDTKKNFARTLEGRPPEAFLRAARLFTRLAAGGRRSRTVDIAKISLKIN
ncbi:MAG TPA: hypothetical protein PLS03_13350, partial [Terrimicrobiaceae bacterium]|nr:hypothetical protein [Terrimicrobiaceae bacterium]